MQMSDSSQEVIFFAVLYSRQIFCARLLSKRYIFRMGFLAPASPWMALNLWTKESFLKTPKKGPNYKMRSLKKRFQSKMPTLCSITRSRKTIYWWDWLIPNYKLNLFGRCVLPIIWPKQVFSKTDANRSIFFGTSSSNDKRSTSQVTSSKTVSKAGSFSSSGRKAKAGIIRKDRANPRFCS